MKNNWVEKVIAFTEIEVIGNEIDPFVNKLITEKVYMKEMRRNNQNTLIMQIPVSSLKTVRAIVRIYDVKITFKRKFGLPFFIQYMKRNNGIVVGIVLFFILIFVLSNMIWSIKIEGASLKTEEKLKKTLAKQGVTIGKFNFMEKEASVIQENVIKQMPELIWVGVELRGSVYRLKVVEKKAASKDKDKSFSKIVAAKKAIIYSTYVETGQLQVEKKQLVKKGEKLVSGYIGKEEKLIYVGAKGEVIGETWYKTTSTVPTKSKIETLTGNKHCKYKINLFGFTFPVWGFWGPDYKQMQTHNEETRLYFFKWKLPFKVIRTISYEKIVTEQSLTIKEASALALENARQDIRTLIPYDAKIKEENILQKRVSNDNVKLVIHYEVLENIAKGVK